MKNRRCEECGRPAVVFRKVMKNSSRSSRAGKPVCLPHHTLCTTCFEKLIDSAKGWQMAKKKAKKPADCPQPVVIEKGKESAATVIMYCRSKGYPEPIAEVSFHPTRKWRFDLAWPKLKTALEFEGFASGGGFGRHQRIDGYTKDCEKYSEAALMGWKVLRATHAMVKSGVVFGWLDRLFADGADNPHDDVYCGECKDFGCNGCLT